MVRLLIRLFADQIARNIEHGSRRGAWIGLFVGLGVGVIGAIFLNKYFLDEGFNVALTLPPIILGGLAGPLIGSRFGGTPGVEGPR